MLLFPASPPSVVTTTAKRQRDIAFLLEKFSSFLFPLYRHFSSSFLTRAPAKADTILARQPTRQNPEGKLIMLIDVCGGNGATYFLSHADALERAREPTPCERDCARGGAER